MEKPIKVSIIIATRNRAYALADCLDSVIAAIKKATPVTAEIIIVDNGSTDNTADALKAWAGNCPVPVQLLHEPLPGLSRSQNRAMRAAYGDIFVFTDDDCRMQEDYIVTLLHHDAEDTGPVLRGGRVELGDPSDLPLTIFTRLTTLRWSIKENTLRHEGIAGKLNGCNMTMHRSLVEQVGYFDEGFGSGAYINSGGDSDFYLRTYLAGIPLEYSPDMVVYHYHGRKKKEEAYKLIRSYCIANGALYIRYLFRLPFLCIPFYRRLKDAIKEILTGKNLGWPEMGITAKAIVLFNLQGMLKYSLMKIGIRYS